MHRDVKPANIMMDEEHKMIVFVDFGLCRKFSSTTMCTGESVRCMTGVTGTYGYMVPEVSRKKQYDAKIDVYSGSMVVSFMLLGGTPFPRIPGLQVSQLMERQNLRPNLSSCQHRELVRLLTRA
jgi:serine/threonine protein kinase